MPGEFSPGALLEVLLRHGVRFVVIGGMAALAHGSPFPTEDVDITPDAGADNIDRLSAALRELDARIRVDDTDAQLPFNHDAASLAAATVWNLTTRFGDLDISLAPSGTQGYADLARDATNVPAYGLVVPFASLADIVRSKQAANRLKDQRVLPVLRQILAARFDGTRETDSPGARA